MVNRSGRTRYHPSTGGAVPFDRRRFATILVLIALCAALAIIIASSFTRVDVGINELAVSASRIASPDFPVPGAAVIQNPQSVPRFGVPSTPATPRNVVLIIGDGMGIGHLSVGSTLLHGPAGGLGIESAPVVGLMRTWAANDLVSDSAAAASAMATGLKTERRVVSMQPDGSAPPTLFDVAAALGLSTGFVTTSGLVDATPAGFLTHAPSRYEYRLILEQMLESEADVLIGGDFANHVRASRMPDYVKLARSVETAAPQRWTVIRDPARLESAGAPLIAFFAPRPGQRFAHGPQLARSATVAIDLLSLNPLGFLLVIECEETDEGAHDNDLDRVLRALEELDAAVAEVLGFAAERGDTLVLVTADHDTGIPAIVDGTFDDGFAEVRWGSDDHAANWVPLFAFGPGASRFGGVLDNTQIGRRIAELLGFDEFPPAS